MNVEIVGRLRPTVASDRTLDAGGLASNAGNGNLSIEGSQRLVNKVAGNSFAYASENLYNIGVSFKLTYNVLFCMISEVISLFIKKTNDKRKCYTVQ